MSIKTDYEIIIKSNMFDENYYRKTYNIDKNIDPIYHFLVFGLDKNYNPSNEFNTKEYLEENSDVKNADINPFVHYIKYGKKEGRLPKIKDFNEIKSEYIFRGIDLMGKNEFIFSSRAKSELIQHYDPNYNSNFDVDLFSKNLTFKRKYFNKYGIYYDFFVIPDKSIICRNLLPFKFNYPFRLINN